MQLEVQWFISIAVSNQLLEQDYCTALNDSLGGNPDLMTFAQSLLDQVAESDPENVDTWTANIQQIIDLASQQAASGAVPGDAAEMPDEVSSGYENGGGTSLEQLVAEARNVSSMTQEEVVQYMQRLLTMLREIGASDLHISSEAPLFIRKELKLNRPDPDWVISDEDCRKLNLALLSEAQKAQFEEEQDLNFALEFAGGRYRAALMYQKNGMSASYRIIPGALKPLAELGFLPEDVVTIERLLDYSNGLILVTGPIGNGKTTTLASMIEVANQRRQDHIISVEDPIEVLIPSKNCQVTQRQIGVATKSYHAALKGALREDPDIIVIGELNDLETIENAITASETGHLVIGTLPTCDAANTLNRLLDVFPPSQQPQIRAMTSGSLRGIICQKLVPSLKGGLTPCYEILINTLGIANNIQDGTISNLKSNMEIGSKNGMFTMDQKALELYQKNILSYEVARSLMVNTGIQEQIDRFHAIAEAKRIVEENKAAAAAKKRR